MKNLMANMQVYNLNKKIDNDMCTMFSNLYSLVVFVLVSFES